MTNIRFKKRHAEFKKPKSVNEELLAFQLDSVNISGWEREQSFTDSKGWLVDFMWKKEKIIVEVEGGLSFYVNRKIDGKRVRVSGKHTSKKGFSEDCEKYEKASILGWKVIRVTGDNVRSGEALIWIEIALGIYKGKPIVSQ